MSVDSGSAAGLVQWTCARCLEVGQCSGACGQRQPSSCVDMFSFYMKKMVWKIR